MASLSAREGAPSTILLRFTCIYTNSFRIYIFLLEDVLFSSHNVFSIWTCCVILFSQQYYIFINATWSLRVLTLGSRINEKEKVSLLKVCILFDRNIKCLACIYTKFRPSFGGLWFLLSKWLIISFVFTVVGELSEVFSHIKFSSLTRSRRLWSQRGSEIYLFLQLV